MADNSPPSIALSAPDSPSMPSDASVKARSSLLPSPPEIPISKPRSVLSAQLYRYGSAADQSLVRLRRLLVTTAGLETFLSTLNYAVYILAYLESNPPSRPAFLQQLSRFVSRRQSASKNLASPLSSSSATSHPTSPFKNLGALISSTRTTLRLTGLLPLYVWLRELLAKDEEQDRYLRAISLTQCFSYILFQFVENVAFLADRGIISQKWLGRWGGSAKWWMVSSRAWLVGVSCDFLRLFREAFIRRQKRTSIAIQAQKGETEAETEERERKDREWWNQMFVATCWAPLCVHYSLQDGLMGVNSGVVGLLGFMAGAQSFAARWAATKAT